MQRHISEILHDFESFLIAQAPRVPSFHAHYEKAIWEMVQNGGKRFRPALIFSILNALNPKLIPQAFIPALSIECIHTYSLIHDDLPCMDNASLRRGHPTLHTKYGQTLALLVGDGLNTYAFALLTQAELEADIKLTLIESLALNAGIGGMVLGQMLDCEFENQRLALSQLQTIHTNKTAKLIATSLYFGGIIARADSKLCAALYDFGLDLGVYFQLRDDIIDICQDSEQAGKTTQNDTHKNSYVNLLGLEQAKVEFHKQRQSLQQRLNTFESCINQSLSTLLEAYFQDIT